MAFFGVHRAQQSFGPRKRIAIDGVLPVLSAPGFFKVAFIFNKIGPFIFPGKAQ